MAVEACVKAILCPLGNSVLSALNGIITSQVALLEAQVVTITAQIVVLEVQLVPVTAAQALANNAVAAVRSAGNLVPVAVMAGCFDLGDMQVKLDESLDASLAAVNRVLEEANRALSFKAELEQLRDEINATIAKLGEIQLAIAECNT